MDTFRKLRTRSALILTVVAALTLSAASAQAVPPPEPNTDPPCEWWSWGTHSACDGRVPESGGLYADVCWGESTPTVVDVVDIRAGEKLLAEVYLWYDRGPRSTTYPGGACRTIFASIVVWSGSGCYAKVQRNSDGQAFYTFQWRGVATPVVYDAGVTSYAWGICDYGGSKYSAQTRSY